MSQSAGDPQGIPRPAPGWYVRHDPSQVFGPYNDSAMIQAAQSGNFGETSEVMHPQQTQSHWVAVREIPSLAPYLPQLPASIPRSVQPASQPIQIRTKEKKKRSLGKRLFNYAWQFLLAVVIPAGIILYSLQHIPLRKSVATASIDSRNSSIDVAGQEPRPTRRSTPEIGRKTSEPDPSATENVDPVENSNLSPNPESTVSNQPASASPVPRRNGSGLPLGQRTDNQEKSPRRLSDLLNDATTSGGETFFSPQRIDVDFASPEQQIMLCKTTNPPHTYAAEYQGVDYLGKDIAVLPSKRGVLETRRWLSFRFPDSNSLTIRLKIVRADGNDYLMVENRMKNGAAFTNNVMHGIIDQNKNAIKAEEQKKAQFEKREFEIEMFLQNGGVRTLEEDNRRRKEYNILKYTLMPKNYQDLSRLRAAEREFDQTKRQVQQVESGWINLTKN